MGASEYAFLLSVYLLIFLLDEIAVLVAAVGAMRIGRLDQKQGRVLKLGGGMLMLVLAVVMLARPALLEGVAGAAVVLGVAAALTAAAMLVHGHVLGHRRLRYPSARDRPGAPDDTLRHRPRSYGRATSSFEAKSLLTG